MQTPLQLPPLHTQPEVSTSGAAAGNNSLKFFLRKNSGEKSKNYGTYPNVIGNHPTFNLQNSGFIYNSTNVSSCTNSVLQAPPDFCVTLHENSSAKVFLHPNLSHAACASFKALTFTLIYIYTDLWCIHKETCFYSISSFHVKFVLRTWSCCAGHIQQRLEFSLLTRTQLSDPEYGL